MHELNSRWCIVILGAVLMFDGSPRLCSCAGLHFGVTLLLYTTMFESWVSGHLGHILSHDDDDDRYQLLWLIIPWCVNEHIKC